MKQKILIVEDEQTLRRNLAIFLSTSGYDIRCASCGEDAIGLLHHRFDIVITDICLGDMDGLALVRQIVAASPATGVIVMTAHGSLDSASAAFRSGAHDFIPKPFALEEMEQRVKKLTRYLTLEREIASLRKEVQKLQGSNQ